MTNNDIKLLESYVLDVYEGYITTIDSATSSTSSLEVEDIAF